MKRKPTANPSSLFLLELIFAILFFSVTSAVCVQVFVKSHTLSTQAHGANRRCEWFAGDDSDGWKYDAAGADGGSGEPQYG